MRRLLARTPFALAMLLVAAHLACATATPPPPRVSLSDGWLAMGTFFELDLRVAPEDQTRAREWIEETRADIARLERIYSRHDPASELSIWNRRWAQEGEAAQDPDPPPMSHELRQILEHAAQLRVATEGAFDVGVGSVVDLWVEAEGAGARPSAARLDDALGTTDRDRGGNRRVDLDGMSKGEVLDKLRERFSRAFPRGAALFSFGQSSILAVGAPAEGSWRLLLQSSDASRGRLGEVLLRDQALSMSSTRGHVYRVDGEPVSHVIDPATGQPVAGLVEAIVISDSAMLADAWSTALLVLERIPKRDDADPAADFEAMLIRSTGERIETHGWLRAAQ